MSIEDVARDSPEALITEPVDIMEGLTDEIALRVVKGIGFCGEQAEQVLVGIMRGWCHNVAMLFTMLLTFDSCSR